MKVDKISVIIPVYNAAATLLRCLDSLLAQTFRDFEIICVDDGSTDESLALLQDAAARRAADGDVRIVVLHQSNTGTFVARKRGVAAARGDYLCFVDPDDTVKPRFLEKLVRTAERGDWDIVQCGVELEETRERTEQQRAVSERYFNPDAPTVRKGGLLTRAYIHKRIGWNLIFRLFRTSVVQEAFAELPDVNMINETDAAAFFPIARRARRFRRIRDRLYVYRYGDGISTRTSYTLPDYARTLGKFDFIRNYAPKVSGIEAEAAFVAMAARMAENSRKSVFARMADGGQRTEALSLLAKSFAAAPRKITHVGIHYFNLKVGGVQRVVLQVVDMLRGLGVKVTLFLEDHPDDTWFPVPEGVAVRMLPRSLGNMLPDERRIPEVARILRESGIDCWYDHAVFAPGFVMNVVTAKWLLGLQVIAHYHTVFTAPLSFRVHPEYFELQSHWLRLADVVLALGRVDVAYFRSQAVPAVVVPNPLPEACRRLLDGPMPQPEGRTVLWCGRQSWEKHPEDAKKIVECVRGSLPDVELEMVSGIKDPYPHFARASIYLSTSEMEGFSMTSAEALAHGLPVVAYRLANLDLYRDNPAVFQVDQGDVTAAAEQIVAVLTRSDYGRLREQAREVLRKFASFDHKAFWRHLLAGERMIVDAGDDLRIKSEIAELLAEARTRYAVCGQSAFARRDPVTITRIRIYVRDNGLLYTVRKVILRGLEYLSQML